MRNTIEALQEQAAPLVCLTAYSAAVAKAADPHCDLLLVGDTVAMMIYGHDSTRNADMEMMVRHGAAVVKATENALIIVDMPYGSYENDPVEALTNAQRLMDETGCDGVKLEGGIERVDTIAYLVANDIPVMGHIGLLPQSIEDAKGYKVQGREQKAAEKLINDAKTVEKAGAFCVVIEAVPEPLATEITKLITIPTIGIGASNQCDGQILVSDDMLGMTSSRVPKFVKQYADLHKIMDDAIGHYAAEVKNRSFPADINTYKATSTTPQKKIA